MMISAASIKAQVAYLMNERATIQRVVRAELGEGRWDEVETTIATDAPCRIAPLSSQQIDIAMRRYGEVTHAGIFDPDLELEPQYLVTDSRGREFTVTEVIEPSIAGTFQKAIMYQRRSHP